MSYYRWRNKPDRDEHKLIERIRAICSKHKRRYGYRRVTAVLRSEHQLTINHKRASRIMAENHLQAQIRRKKFIHFKSDVIVKKEDLIKRHFKADSPNLKWYTDISTITIGETHLYLSAIIDGFNNEVISTVVSSSPNLELAFETVNQAIRGRKIDKLILHSDQGSLYTSPKFQEFLKEKNIIQSMSWVGVCYDNVLIESFFKFEDGSLLFSRFHRYQRTNH